MTIPIDLLEQAACAGTDPEAFFPPPGAGQREATRAAIKICMTCPVRLACLTEALEFTELGVWGGTSEKDRQKLSTGKRRPPRWEMAS